MALPSDITQRVQAARAKGFTDDQIRADIKRKYGEDYTMPAAASPAKSKNLFQKIGSFLGIENFGKGLGVAAATGSKDVEDAQASQDALRKTTAQLYSRAASLPAGEERSRLLKVIANNNRTLGDTATDAHGVTDAPTKKQFLASAANTALNIAGAGTIGGKTAAGGTLKTGQLVSRKLAEQPLKAAVLQSAAQGGMQSAANRWGEGGSAGEVMQAGAGGAAIAGATTGIIGLLGKLFRHGTSTVPETVYKTSTQMKRGDDASQLIKEGITGNRSEVVSKAKAMNKGSWETALATSEAADVINPADATNYGPLKEALARAERLGGSEAKGAKEAVEQLITSRTPTTRAELMKLVQDIDSTTPAAAFADRSTSVRSSIENTIADAYRNLTQGGSSEITRQMDRAQASRQVINAIQRQLESKESVPGFISGLVQRGLITPAIGTRIARAMYLSGAPARALDKTAMNDAVRRALKAVITSGEANALIGE